jgi:hypothetical protein
MKNLLFLICAVVSIGKSIYFEFSLVTGCVLVSWKEVVCIFVVITGAILFLYGANYFNALIGWMGFFLLSGGFFAEIIFKAYEHVRKRRDY